ncbi:hypothetical protein D3C79_49620 [compost metagenome]
MDLPLAKIGENGGADYIKHSYYHQEIPNKEQCSRTLRVAACERLVKKIKKGSCITQISVRSKVKE